jgi:hypothetical protein
MIFIVEDCAVWARAQRFRMKNGGFSRWLHGLQAIRRELLTSLKCEVTRGQLTLRAS